MDLLCNTQQYTDPPSEVGGDCSGASGHGCATCFCLYLSVSVIHHTSVANKCNLHEAARKRCSGPTLVWVDWHVMTGLPKGKFVYCCLSQVSDIYTVFFYGCFHYTQALLYFILQFAVGKTDPEDVLLVVEDSQSFIKFHSLADQIST